MKTKHFFNLFDPNQGIARALSEGVETRIFPGDNVMLSVVRIAGNQSSKPHSHAQEQWGVMLQGNGVRLQDGIEHEVSEGDFWQTPSNVVHSFCAGPDGALVLDIFSPPRDEYRQAGAGLAANLEG